MPNVRPREDSPRVLPDASTWRAAQFDSTYFPRRPRCSRGFELLPRPGRENRPRRPPGRPDTFQPPFADYYPHVNSREAPRNGRTREGFWRTRYTSTLPVIEFGIDSLFQSDTRVFRSSLPSSSLVIPGLVVHHIPRMEHNLALIGIGIFRIPSRAAPCREHAPLLVP